jgi:hypothetical protein
MEIYRAPTPQMTGYHPADGMNHLLHSVEKGPFFFLFFWRSKKHIMSTFETTDEAVGDLLAALSKVICDHQESLPTDLGKTRE